MKSRGRHYKGRMSGTLKSDYWNSCYHVAYTWGLSLKTDEESPWSFIRMNRFFYLWGIEQELLRRWEFAYTELFLELDGMWDPVITLLIWQGNFESYSQLCNCEIVSSALTLLSWKGLAMWQKEHKGQTTRILLPSLPGPWYVFKTGV